MIFQSENRDAYNTALINVDKRIREKERRDTETEIVSDKGSLLFRTHMIAGVDDTIAFVPGQPFFRGTLEAGADIAESFPDGIFQIILRR